MSYRKFKLKSSVATSLVTLSAIAIAAPVQAALEEIIVTANKREETANQIGMSISAVSGQRLAEQKLTSLEEITSIVPGLVFATSQQNTPILTLRGVGFNESSLGVYPATSLYVDEIPLPFPVMAAHSAYDLERVEVLKGPQGVLFGQNSTGGAINFIAAKPTQELSYGGDFSYGRFNKIETNAFVSGGLTESTSARLSIQAVNADEWQKSVTRGDENGEESYAAARLQLRFEPTDTAEINLNINGWRDKSDPQAMQLIAVTPKNYEAAPANALRQAAIPFASESNNRQADWSEVVEPSGDKEFFQGSLRGDFELTDTLSLTALVAYSDYKQNQIQDGDGTSMVTADFGHNKGGADSTFSEIRLSADYDDVRWILGTNYEKSTTKEDQLLLFYPDNTTYRPQTFYINQTGSLLEQDIESYAIFGNVDYFVTDRMTAKLGARYTNTAIDAYSCNYAPPNAPGTIDASGNTATPVDAGSNAAAFWNFLGGLSGKMFDPIGIGDCFSLNGAPGEGVPGFLYENSLDEDNVSWRAGLDYKLNEDILIYGNISKGYKSGSFPNIAANEFSQLDPVNQESVLSYEAGFKMSMAEGRVQWNGAIFHYDYQDKQVRGKTDIFLFGPIDRLVNVPESTIMGVETDITASLTEELTLTASVVYLDSEVDKYFGFDVYAAERDLSGNEIPYTPEFTYTLGLDYRRPLAQGGVVFLGMNATGQSTSDAVFDAGSLSLAVHPKFPDSVNGGFHKSITENYFEIDGYTTVDARLGYESADGRWKAMLWGKNLTDEHYYNSVVASSEGAARVTGRPLTYGITVGYQF